MPGEEGLVVGGGEVDGGDLGGKETPLLGGGEVGGRGEGEFVPVEGVVLDGGGCEEGEEGEVAEDEKAEGAEKSERGSEYKGLDSVRLCVFWGFWMGLHFVMDVEQTGTEWKEDKRKARR